MSEEVRYFNSGRPYYQEIHYGDALLCLDIMKKTAKVNKVKCQYYANMNYIGKDINVFHEYISLDPLVKLADSDGVDSLSLGGMDVLNYLKNSNPNNLNLLCYPPLQPYFEMNYEIINFQMNSVGLEAPYKSVEDVLFEGDIFMKKDVSLKFDVLIQNSIARSSQMHWSEEAQNKYFEVFAKVLESKNITFITTKKINDYPCTLDHGMSILDIARLGANCKVIVGVPTGPFVACFNKYTYEKTNQIIDLSHFGLILSLPKFKNYRPEDFTIDMLGEYL